MRIFFTTIMRVTCPTDWIFLAMFEPKNICRGTYAIMPHKIAADAFCEATMKGIAANATTVTIIKIPADVFLSLSFSARF